MNLDERNYQLDPRTLAAARKKPQLDEKTMRLIFVLCDDEDDEEIHTLPAKYAVCDTCGGRGKHVNPAIDASGLTQDDFDEDPDFAEGYWGGRYDVGCYECKGARVVPVPNEDAMNDDERELYDKWIRSENDDAAYDRMCAMERAMGA